MVSSEVKIDELKFPHHKQSIIDQNKEDTQTNILSRVSSGATWVPYDKSLPTSKYQTAHYDLTSDTLILRLVDEPDTYTRTTQSHYFRDILGAQKAYVASLHVVQGLPNTSDEALFSEIFRNMIFFSRNLKKYEKI